MSSIKPPDGRSSSVLPQGGSSPEPSAAERAGGASFRQALDEARAAGSTGAPSAAPAEAPVSTHAADPIAELASAVRSGALSGEQAVERLVDRAVSGVGGRLSEAQRLELTAVLRHALDHDPALRELRDALK